MTIPGKEIFHSTDDYGIIQVFDDGNKRYLAFGEDDEQSCQLKQNPAHLQHEYARAMLLALLFCPSPQSALLLGLGGGSLASCLHQHYPHINITAVELRQAVINIAYDYFNLPRSPRLHIEKADATAFLNQQPDCEQTLKSKFDIIFSDIYHAAGLDGRQLQVQYIKNCTANLNQNGWLVLNYWQQHRANSNILSQLKEHFATVFMCTTSSGNWVVWASQQHTELAQKELQQRARDAGKRYGFSLQPVLLKSHRVK